jgi:hypothetical protein
MSKRNKRTGRRLEEPSTPSAPNPAASRTAKVWSLLIAIGSIGGFVSLLEKVWTFAISDTKPNIRALNLSSNQFSLPFVIKNESTVFTMRDAKWACGVTPSGGSIKDISLLSYGTPTDVLPGRSLLARCPVPGEWNVDATIIPVVSYTTFGLPRSYSETSFTWLANASPPQWIEGKQLK